ncbi:hypothetical protein ACFFU1_10750 [Algibacter miyuki]|uniref:Uncharacterized protein n=1 Tax=Algibacter miyuki TaxID=1306933 RepID=A0ABV5H0H7_9FLAO|nr:hypothetical protein [Algibacter miyuki]MDN3667377.1 hypothetical protein [Algibacter miyuki]
MINTSQNHLTNSRVGRIWSRETLNDKESEGSNTSIMSSREDSKQNTRY